MQSGFSKENIDNMLEEEVLEYFMILQTIQEVKMDKNG